MTGVYKSVVLLSDFFFFQKTVLLKLTNFLLKISKVHTKYQKLNNYFNRNQIILYIFVYFLRKIILFLLKQKVFFLTHHS